MIAFTLYMSKLLYNCLVIMIFQELTLVAVIITLMYARLLCERRG